MAYGWCSAVCKEFRDLADGEELLFLSLEIGFRGLDSQYQWTDIRLVHTNHHQHMAEIVFNSGDEEVIADFLQAWLTHDNSLRSSQLLDTWAKHFVLLQHVTFTSRRLWRLTVRSVERLGFDLLQRVGVEGIVPVLDRLRVDIDDVDSRNRWLQLLLEIVRSPEGRRSLGYPYWELMVELAVSGAWFLCGDIDFELQVMISLEEEQEWDILECWTGFVWLLRHPKINGVPEDLERVTLSLFRQRSGATQKLGEWLQRSGMHDAPECLEFLRWICERAGFEAVSQQRTL